MLEVQVFSLDIAEVSQRSGESRGILTCIQREQPDTISSRLCVCRERPCTRCANNETDKFTPFHERVLEGGGTIIVSARQRSANVRCGSKPDIRCRQRRVCSAFQSGRLDTIHPSLAADA